MLQPFGRAAHWRLNDPYERTWSGSNRVLPQGSHSNAKTSDIHDEKKKDKGRFSSKVVRVLLLHGWAGNAGVIERMTRRLCRRLKDLVDFVIPSAPISLPPLESPPPPPRRGRPNARAWFVYNMDNPSDTNGFLQTSTVKYYKWEESVRHLHKICKDEGPFDGIMGFSQGAAAVHLLLQGHFERIFTKFRFRFVVLAAGFAGSGCGNGWSHKIEIPSLHFSGDADTTVPPCHQSHLFSCFSEKNRVLSRHLGGHILPQKSKDVATIRAFIEKYSNASEHALESCRHKLK
mmetsp:Transcript_13/g.12  ORF Transcript_13/g.12 Transcript_13/m.12 type:complete len:289 (+) Transcript_13:57-923(+)